MCSLYFFYSCSVVKLIYFLSFRYIKANDGIDTEASYPYKARDGRCHYNPADVGATDTGKFVVTIIDFSFTLLAMICCLNNFCCVVNKCLMFNTEKDSFDGVFVRK